MSLILIGAIGAPFGIKGQMKIRTFTQSPMTLFTFDKILINEANTVLLRFVRILNDQSVIASIEGVNDRTEAQKWSGTSLYTTRDCLPPIDNIDSFYIADLIGMTVRNSTDNLGTVTGVFNFGASDILEFLDHATATKKMIPFIPDAVLSIDIEKKSVNINPDFAL